MAGMKQYWLGSPDSDDRLRSPDEVRIIREMTSEEIEKFLVANPVDTGSANQLRKEPPYIALQVIDRGALKGCRDPSGVLVARMRDARRGTLAPAPSAQPLPPIQPLDPNASELEKFCAINRIDQSATNALKAEPEEVQKAVMARGPLTNARNPSGSLMSRIRIVKEGGPAALQQQALGMPPAGQPATLMSILGLAGAQAQPPPPLGAPPLAITGGPQPALPGLQQPPAPPSGGAVGGFDMASEALKAVQKMSQATQPAAAGSSGAPALLGGSTEVLAAAEKQLRNEMDDTVNPDDL